MGVFGPKKEKMSASHADTDSSGPTEWDPSFSEDEWDELEDELEDGLEDEHGSDERLSPVGTPRNSALKTQLPALLAERERGGGPLTPPQAINRRLASLFIPENPTLQCAHNDRGYVGKFSRSGDLYAAAWQGSRAITIFKTFGATVDMLIAKTVHCRTLRWTVCDLAITSDERFIAYSTIAPVIHIASVGDLSSSTPTTSIANVTDIHETLHLRDEDVEYGEGVWAVRWSEGDDTILAGSSAGCYLYDVRSNKVSRRFVGHHQDDVNAVCYADDSGNVFYSGSDDSLILAHDRRVKSPVGGFVGHVAGLTYLDSADGRWLLSNSKDQTAKLWDVRASLVSFAEAKKDRSSRDVPRLGFDYRWQAPRRLSVHPRDRSVTTYHGHAVLQTLIRAKFSPDYTNRAFVYSGSACGCVHIWDRHAGGLPIRVLGGGHDDVVRDVDWSPRSPFIASVGFEGHVVTWDC